MRALGMWLLVVAAFVVLALVVGTQFNESAANKEYARGQSRAMVIEAQGQNRLDTAQAQSIETNAQAQSRLTAATAQTMIMAVLLPYAIVGGLGVLGIIVLFMVFYHLSKPQSVPQIERQIVYVLQPGQTPRMFYTQLNREEIYLGRERDGTDRRALDAGRTTIDPR